MCFWLKCMILFACHFIKTSIKVKHFIYQSLKNQNVDIRQAFFPNTCLIYIFCQPVQVTLQSKVNMNCKMLYKLYKSSIHVSCNLIFQGFYTVLGLMPLPRLRAKANKVFEKSYPNFELTLCLTGPCQPPYLHQLFTYYILLHVTPQNHKTYITYLLSVVNPQNMQLGNFRRLC